MFRFIDRISTVKGGQQHYRADDRTRVWHNGEHGGAEVPVTISFVSGLHRMFLPPAIVGGSKRSGTTLEDSR